MIYGEANSVYVVIVGIAFGLIIIAWAAIDIRRHRKEREQYINEHLKSCNQYTNVNISPPPHFQCKCFCDPKLAADQMGEMWARPKNDSPATDGGAL